MVVQTVASLDVIDLLVLNYLGLIVDDCQAV